MSQKLSVRMMPIADLVPYAKNARTHSAAQVAQIAASIREFGFTNPVLVDANKEIVAGHGRVLAAQSLGLAEVPTISLGHLTHSQAAAFRIADNRIALSSGWDEKLLAVELADLRAGGADLNLLGFGAAELNKLLTGSSGADGEDDTPDAPADPVTLAGDLWELGGHRLICADATDEDAIAKLLGGEIPNLMVTDPPYGVNYDPEWRTKAKGPNGRRLSNGQVSMGVVANDDRADWREAWALFPGATAYVWHGGLHGSVVQQSLEAEGFQIRAQIIWAKPQAAISRGDYHWQHEPCLYAVRKGKAGGYVGDRKQKTIWEIANNAGGRAKDDGATDHSTQKPVECMRRPIVNGSMPGAAIYEPFSGSGTTIIAAETTGRRCFAVELMPAYVDMAVLRWQAFAKGEARLAGDGRTFAEVAAARRAPPARSPRGPRKKKEPA